MLHFRMTMPLYLMMFSGSILLLIVLLLRCLLKKDYLDMFSLFCEDWYSYVFLCPSL